MMQAILLKAGIQNWIIIIKGIGLHFAVADEEPIDNDQWPIHAIRDYKYHQESQKQQN